MCLMTSIFMKGGKGGGGAKIRIPMLIFGNGNPYIY